MAPSTSSSSSSSSTTSVQVALRIRPPTAQDAVSIPARFQRTVIHASSPTQVQVDPVNAVPSSSGSTSSTSSPSSASASAATNKKQLFSFDHVLPPEATQHGLFTQTAQPLLQRFLDGFNCTILAYGQTSSGKTFTMTGQDLDADPDDPHNSMGIIPRAVSSIFNRARALKNERGPAWSFSVKASFIEIYNEDLIDLLSDGGHSEVQIRENKDGSIIWGGLREVAVNSPAEVMQLLRQGTSIRRTNETDMNAQSSRSHAIFSLTLTQRKFTGSGSPGRAPSPLPGGRSPSRLARPGSMFSTPPRVTSPTQGRPSTPSGGGSFASAMARGGGHQRPASSLGHHLDTPRKDGAANGGGGEWITVVSKFHFVDLAGSERLKRTAAAGERIKEGISINSGLLALGNVISALGDPARAKSHTATYVPYRDSKLTRLLQDSLGGNAHTLMIACVSAAEWNAAETVNTLKYANRARNIKNRATINEREEGWDDVEWLQATVTRLRKEVKAIKEGGPVPPAGASEQQHSDGPGGAASKKLLQSLDELKANYEDLREKYVARNEELTRLRKEHGEHARSATTGTVGGMSKYEEIVGPVIEEYEKSISSLEAELALNRAALRHTNELVEEKEEELNALTERKEATELYVDELRSRLAKITEREALTEAYVRDLEEKLKQYDDSSASSTDSMNDLRRELARYKDTEARSTAYISDLESRLAKADESVLALRQTVERLEHESDRRRTEIVSLQGRLEDFKRDGEGWRSDLEAREARVKDLEAKMEEWEKARKEAQAERERLGAIASAVADAEKTHASAAASSVSLVTTSSTDGSGEPAPIETELVTLRQTHTATLADLDAVSAKYRDALREISDLAAQINELRLSGAAAPPAPIAESPERTSVELPALSPPMSAGGSGRRRVGREGSLSANGHPGSRRLFFRHAASAESLHSRSLSQSQSLSQELSSAHSRKTSFSSHSSHSSIGGSPNGHKPSLSITLPALQVSPHERSAQSLEKEIMRLQEVLRERETEIGVLERELKVQQQGPRAANGEETPATMTTATTSARSDSGSATPQTPATSTPSPTMDGRAPDLSPGTVFRFEKIRNGLQSAIENGNGHAHHDSVSTVDHDEQLERLNELMRAMAQKESQHREIVDGLQTQLTQLRRQHDELTALSSNQAHNMSAELAALRKGHDADLARLEDVVAREKDVRVMLDAAQAENAAARETHDQALARLREEHAEAVRARAEEVDKLVERIRAEHAQELERTLAQVTELEKAHGTLRAEHDARAEELAEVQRERDEHVATLKAKEDEAAKTEEEYYNALTRLRTEHADALARQAETHASLVSRLRDEHAAAVRVLEIAREGSANESEGAQAQAMRGLQDEHAATLARREAAFAEDIARAREEHLRALSALADEHGASTEKIHAEHAAQLAKAEERLAMAERQHEAARAEADSALAAVKEQHASVMNQIAAAHEDEVAKLVLQHATALEAATTQARAERDALARRHTEELAALRAEHDEAIKRAIEQAQGEHAALQQSHSDRSLAALREHEAAVQEERARAEAERDRLVQEHAAARAAHEKALAELHAILATEQEGHRDALDSVKRVEEALAVEKDQLSAAAAALQMERDTLSRDRDELRNELKSYQAAVDEHTLAREQDQLRLAQDAETIQNLHQDLSDAHNEREELAQQVAALRAELATTTDRQTTIVQEASKRESLVQELEKHRSVLAETQRTLQRVKDEKDAMQEEKLRQEFAMRDLQAQLARVPSPSQDHIPTPASPSLHSRPGAERTMSTFSRSKLPPPTPPPSVPPPPAPAPSAPLPRVAEHHAHSSVASSTPAVSTTSSRDSEMITVDSPATSVMQHPPAPDPKLIAQVEEQARAIEEQEAMIKTLNKQLTHCESDLQAHMDLVTTLETSLGDSEKNLRKVRMQATELARERDTLNQLIDSLRGELAEAKREVVTVRRSVVEEKQSLEHRLDEERRAKEKARQQLDVRMEELQKRKSKFVCL